MTHSLVFPFSVLNVVNLLFYTSFYWTWTTSPQVFVKWPVGKDVVLTKQGVETLPKNYPF